MAKKQTCILVLGMHRSGTSALTGTLSLLDVYLGTDLMFDEKSNKKGHFENNFIYEINEKLLSEINSSWDDVFYDENKLEDIKAVNELKTVINKEFQYAKLFAIKDPRLAFLFPVYKKVLEELGIDIKIILPFRNPLEVANSLNKRDDMPLEKGMLLWAYHFLLTEKFSRKNDRVFIEFDKLISDTFGTINEISEKLKLDLNKKYQEKKKEIDEFLEPGLKHHNISIENLSSNTPKIVREALRLKDKFNTADLTSEFDNLRNELFGYQKLFYNASIIKTFNDLEYIKNVVIFKDQELLQIKQRLEQKEQESAQRREKLVQKDRELVQTKQNLAQKEQELKKAEEKLGNKEQQLILKNEELKETKSILNQKITAIAQKEQKLLAENKEKDLMVINKNKEIEKLKKELMLIYTGKSWKITRPLRRLKRMFK